MEHDLGTLKQAQCRSTRPAGPADDEPTTMSVSASADMVATGPQSVGGAGSVNALSLPTTSQPGCSRKFTLVSSDEKSTPVSPTRESEDQHQPHANPKFTLVPLSEESTQRSDIENYVPLAELSVMRDIDSRISADWAIQNVEDSITLSGDMISDADRELSNILDLSLIHI